MLQASDPENYIGVVRDILSSQPERGTAWFIIDQPPGARRGDQ